MTVRSVPIFLQSGSHPAEETRLMLAGMLNAATGSFAGGVASADPAHGVVNTIDLAVTQNGTPNMSVNVAAGGAFIRGTLNANQGAYHLWNDGTVNLAISASNPTNPRRDLIIAQVRDSYYSGADDDARITVVTGTAAASPSDPSLASYPNALVLARVAVAAGATSITTANITDLRTQSDISARLPVYSSTTTRAVAIPSPTDGQGAYLNAGDTTEGVEFWNGTAWRRPWSLPWGVVGKAKATADTTLSTVSQTSIGLAASFTAVTNRQYRISFTASVLASGAALQTCTFELWNAAAKVEGLCSVSVNSTAYYGISGTAYATASAGSVTWTVRALAGGGGGTVVHKGTVSPGWITIEDIGPSGAPA